MTAVVFQRGCVLCCISGVCMGLHAALNNVYTINNSTVEPNSHDKINYYWVINWLLINMQIKSNIKYMPYDKTHLAQES